MGDMTGTDILEQIDAQGGRYALYYTLRDDLKAGSAPVDYATVQQKIATFSSQYPTLQIGEYKLDGANTIHETIDAIRDDMIANYSAVALDQMQVSINLKGIKKASDDERASTSKKDEKNRRDAVGKRLSHAGSGPYATAAVIAGRTALFG
jgi:hypothetical protein